MLVLYVSRSYLERVIEDYEHILGKYYGSGHVFFEKGTRGGISTITTRYGEANNPYMGDEYDEGKPTKYITYLDANNLYGWAMSNPLPTGGFKWMEEEDLKNWKDIPCMVEVDIEYPKELHDAHNEYPFAAERLIIGKVEKLVPNLNNKNKVRCEPHNCEMLRKSRNKSYEGTSRNKIPGKTLDEKIY